MSWQNILKAPPPMQPVGDGKFAPLSVTEAESIDESELNPKELVNKLNAYDLDVKILEHKVGEIDPSIRHIIADKHGISNEVFSQSAKGSGKYIWRGLRMVTERPMGSGKVNELREKFPEWHITMTRNNIVQDAEKMKQYPDAVEYYFSPKQELLEGRQKKYPTRPKKYGKNKRTMIQYKRYLEEGREAGILNPDETVNRDKFKKHFIDRIKDMDTEKNKVKIEDDEILALFIKQALNQFIPKYASKNDDARGEFIDNAMRTNEKLILKQLSIIYEEKMIKLLDDEKTLNSLIGQFSGTAVSLDDLFTKYAENSLSFLKNHVIDSIIGARKDSSWVSKDKINQRVGRGKGNTPRRRKLITTRSGPRPVTKSWFNTLKEDKTKQGKLPKELVEGAHVSKVPIEQWFKKKPSKSKPQKLDDSTEQVSLDRYTEE